MKYYNIHLKFFSYKNISMIGGLDYWFMVSHTGFVSVTFLKTFLIVFISLFSLRSLNIHYRYNKIVQ